MTERIQEQLLTKILAQAKTSCPDSVGAALIEGLPPLARIAFTARIARRAQRFFPFRVESARLVIDSAIGAAEKAASGQEMSEAEDLAASDMTVLRACDLEMHHGDPAAAEAGKVARVTARCVYGSEVAYGENAFLADFHLQRAVAHFVRAAGNDLSAQARITQEERALGNDLDTLILIAEESGDGWINPGAIRPYKERNDRGWARIVNESGVPFGGAGKNRERWGRIHEAVRRTGGRFYSPVVFDTI